MSIAKKDEYFLSQLEEWKKNDDESHKKQQQTIDKLKLQREEFRQKYLHNEVNQPLQENLEAAREEIKISHDRIEELQNELVDARDEMTRRLNVLKLKNSSAIRENQDKYEEQYKRVAELEKELATIEDRHAKEMAKLKNTVYRETQNIQNLAATKEKKLHSSLEEAQREVDLLSSENQNLQSEITVLQAVHLEEIKTANEKSQASIREKQNIIDSLRSEVRDKQSTVESLQTEIESLTSSISQKGLEESLNRLSAAASNNSHPHIKNLREQLHREVQKIKSTSRDMANKTKEVASDAKDKVKETGAEVRDKVKETATNVKNAAVKVEKEHPFAVNTGIIIALAVGVVAGYVGSKRL